MSMVETRYEHIVRNEEDIPIIAEANFKVIRLVTAHLANNWGVRQLQEQYPFLTMGQIYSALAYYWDHRAALDADIERRLQQVERLQQESRPSPLVERLKREGRLSTRSTE